MRQVFKVIFLIITFKLSDLYRILIDDLKVESVDKNYIDVQTLIYNVNATLKAPNTTIVVKVNLPDDTKLSFNTYRYFNNKYNLAVFHLEKSLKEFLEMESFDVQALCLKYSRPPIVWPLQKNVAYRTMGWYPDASKYPRTVPAGKWKIEQILKLPSVGAVAVANWFVKVEN